jgi:hypothetical protein
MDPLILTLAAMAAWTGDDWCPTPPRPPWPWPWFMRKIIAVLGGIGGVILFQRLIGADADILSVAVVAIASGVTLASLVGGIAAMTSGVNRTNV